MDIRDSMNDAADDAAANPGLRLKAARERAGWSIEHVALKLRLSVAQVTALEKGEREGLPPAAYVRGYLRSYAQLLGLDPQEFTKTHVSAQIPAGEAQRPVVAPKKRAPWEPFAYALFVISVVVAVVWWRMHAGAPSRVAHNTTPSVEAIRVLPPRLQSLAMPGASDGQLSEFPLHRRRLAGRLAPTIRGVQAPSHLTEAGPARRAAARGVPRPRSLTALHKGLPNKKASVQGLASAPKTAPKGVPTPRFKATTGTTSLPASSPSAVPNPGGLISLPQGRHYTTLRIRATFGAVRVSVRDAKGTRLLATRILAGHSVHIVGRPPFSVALSRSRGVLMTVGGHAVALPSAHKGRHLRVTVDR